MNQEREDGFLEHAARNAPVSARVAGVLGIISFVSFGFVDLFVADNTMLSWLLLVRSVVTSLLLLMVGSTFLQPLARFAPAILVATFCVISFGVITVTILVGGSTTGYHEALLLTFFGFAILPTTWGALTYGVLYALVVVAWIAANALLPTGEPAYRLVSTSSILAVAGVIATTLAVYSNRLRARDFDQRKTIADANLRLSALDRAKSRFFANLSHEFRTPLTLALAPLESLIEGTDGELSEIQMRHAQLARRSSLRLLRLVDDLLVLSRLEAASLPLQQRAVDLVSHLGVLVDESMPLAARKGIELTFCGADAPVRVAADPDAMERIFLNLLANALSFTRSGGRVSVHLEAVAGNAVLRVVDSGIGIPAAQLELIFERFYRVQDGTTASRAGAGIGLSLVRELVALHQGQIRAESTPGQGTTITVVLPLLTDEVEPLAISAPAVLVDSAAALPGEFTEAEFELPTVDSPDEPGGLPEWHDVTRRSSEYRFMAIELATERRRTPRPSNDDGRLPRLLIIEDNVDLVRFIGEVLSARYSVMSATDGLSGLRLAQQFLPDVIMCDLMMPVMSGFDVLAQLRAVEETCHIPVIVLSARQDVETRTLARTRGADAFLGKPFQVSELLATVASLLDRIGLRREHVRKESIELAHGVASVLGHTLNEHARALRNRFHAIEGLQPASVDLASMNDTIGAIEKLGQRLATVGVAQNETAAERAFDDLVQMAIDQWTRPESVQVRLVLRAESVFALRPTSLTLAIHELLDNAVQFAGPRARIQVQTSLSPEGDVTLRIDDNGPGVPTEQRERVFQPFYTTRPDHSAGMGLTIVRDILRVHGGTVVFTDSRTGQGTSVLVCLPIESLSPLDSDAV